MTLCPLLACQYSVEYHVKMVDIDWVFACPYRPFLAGIVGGLSEIRGSVRIGSMGTRFWCSLRKWEALYARYFAGVNTIRAFRVSHLTDVIETLQKIW
jgi:hypothetical protein